MSVTPYQGPLVRNLNVAPVDGYLPSAKGLNAYMVAQSSYAVGGIPTSGTNVNPVIMTQPAISQLVINTGSAVAAKSVNATTVTLPTVASAQDVYVDVDTTGSYSTHGGAVGFAPPAVAANALRLYRVTTNAGGVGVASISALASTGPFNPPLTQVMNTNGTNASAVALPSSLSVAQQAQFKNLIINAGILDSSAGEAITTWFGSASVSIGSPPTVTVTPLAGSNTSRGQFTFSISSMANVIGVVIYAYSPGKYPTWGGIVTPLDAPTASLHPFVETFGGGLFAFVPNFAAMSAGVNYSLSYHLFTS